MLYPHWSCSETSVSERLPLKTAKSRAFRKTCSITNRVIEQVYYRGLPYLLFFRKKYIIWRIRFCIMRSINIFLAVPILFLLLFTVCNEKSEGSGNSDKMTTNDVEKEAAEEIAIAACRLKAASIAAALDDRRLAAQVIVSGIDGKGALTEDMKILLRECPAGGIILFRYNLDTDKEAIGNLTAECTELVGAENDGIPPFVAVDHEGGSVNRFNRGVAALPAAFSYWELAQKEGEASAIAKIQEDSFRAATEINGLGINLNFAPVAELLTGDNHEFLDDRSYGHNPLFVSEASAAFIRGMEQAGVLCAAKHFPGSAGPDPHRFPSVLRGEEAELEAIASPFAAIVQSGNARAIMAAHTLVPALDSEIASLSAPVLQGWLRQELGFSGIIVSDDFSMTAAAGTSIADKTAEGGQARAAVRSLAAGADMVLVWPPDLRRTHREILSALEDQRLSRKRLQEAAGRIIFEKIRMGITDGT